MVIKNITGTYTLQPSAEWSSFATQEVRLECDTTLGNVAIFLPEISTLNGAWNVKIYVVDTGLNAFNNNIEIYSQGSDTIDDANNSYVPIDTDGASVMLAISSATQWISIESTLGNTLNSYSKNIFSQTTYGTNIKDLTDGELLGTGVGSLVFFPNQDWKVGDTFRLSVNGFISNLNATTLQIFVYLTSIGLVTISDSGIMTLSASTGKRFSLDTTFVIRADGLPTSAESLTDNMFTMTKNGSNVADTFMWTTLNNTTFNTFNQPQTLSVYVQWGLASPSNSIQSTSATITQLYNAV